MSIDNFRLFDSIILESYNKLELEYISENEYNGKSAIEHFGKCTGKKKYVNPPNYSLLKLFHELDFISKEIKYMTGMIFHLQPYINNTFRTGGQYIQNNEDHRYLVFANFGVQSVYNFWDRLGDLIHIFFETGLRSDSVYISRVINNINKEWKATEHYNKLKNIYDEEIKSNILGLRNESVHNFQLECRHYWGNVEASGNIEEIRRLNNEKFSYPENMKVALINCLKAYNHALDLICELPDEERFSRSS